MRFRLDVPIYKTGVYFLIGETDEVCREYTKKVKINFVVKN